MLIILNGTQNLTFVRSLALEICKLSNWQCTPKLTHIVVPYV